MSEVIKLIEEKRIKMKRIEDDNKAKELVKELEKILEDIRRRFGEDSRALLYFRTLEVEVEGVKKIITKITIEPPKRRRYLHREVVEAVITFSKKHNLYITAKREPRKFCYYYKKIHLYSF